MRHVELVVFENDSILNEKALSLPIGKVSFRQLGVILVGVLAAMMSYFITKEIIVPGVVLAVSLGLGMINTKIMTPDQMIKANLLYLIRGTSLRKKPETIISNNNGKKNTNSKCNTATNNKTEKKKDRALPQFIFPHLESFFTKPSKKKEIASQDVTKTSNNNEKKKSHAVKIRLTPDRMLQVMSIRQNAKNNPNLMNRLLSYLDKSLKNNHNHYRQENFLEDKVTILLDNQAIDEFVKVEKDDGSGTILLDRHSEYDISAVADGKDTNKTQLE